jgi:hypothetical protein
MESALIVAALVCIYVVMCEVCKCNSDSPWAGIAAIFGVLAVIIWATAYLSQQD